MIGQDGTLFVNGTDISKLPELMQVSLFCGLGGMDMGGIPYGIRTGFACDWEKAPEKFYQNNFPYVPFANMDVKNVTLGEINNTRVKKGLSAIEPGDIHILTAGSPCVKLSGANTVDARDFAAENLLMVETIPLLIRELQPKVVWLENSDRLLSSAREDLYDEYKTSLDSILCNYTYQIKVMNAMRYGAFQTRSRAMTVLVRNDVLNGRQINFHPEAERVRLSVQGAHALLPHIKAYWPGQFEENYKSVYGKVFCTLTANGREMVEELNGFRRLMNIEEKKIISNTSQYDFSGISVTNQTKLNGNMVMNQLAERMMYHFRFNILEM